MDERGSGWAFSWAAGHSMGLCAKRYVGVDVFVGMVGFNKASMNSIGDVLDMGEVMRSTSTNRPIVMMISTLKNVASGLVGASGVTTAKSSTCRNRFHRVICHRIRVVGRIIPTKRKRITLRHRVNRLLGRLGSVFRNVCLVGSLSPGASSAVMDCNRHLSSVVITRLVGSTG